MITKEDNEEFIKNDDDISCVTRVTGIIETWFFYSREKIYFPEEFLYAVEECNTESKNKWSVATLTHLKGYMNTIKHVPIKW